MGSASSIQTNHDKEYNYFASYNSFDKGSINKNIYISFDSSQKNNPYIKSLSRDLTKLNYNIKCAEYTDEITTKYTSQEISKMTKKMMNQSCLLIVCISKNSIHSYLQNIEINTALDSNKNILYIMTDNDYASVKYNLLNGLIKDNTWYPLCDEKSLIHLLQHLLTFYIHE